jgi:hypothetical protein
MTSFAVQLSRLKLCVLLPHPFCFVFHPELSELSLEGLRHLIASDIVRPAARDNKP